MSSKSPLLIISLLLVACSGSSAASIGSPLSDQPTTAVTLAPDQPTADAGEEASTLSQDGSVEADAGQAVDAGSDASQADSGGQDAAADATPPPPPPKLYGVTFLGGVGERLIANLPNTSGFTELAYEGYFRLDANTANGLLFEAPGMYCAVSTTGAHAGQASCCTDAAACVYSDQQFGVGVWRHLALTFDNGTVALYEDGQWKQSAPAGFAAIPAYAVGAFPDAQGRVHFGAPSSSASPRTTVDEFRASSTKRYTANFTPVKHLASDGDSILTLTLDEGQGTVSGQATLLGGSSWVEVNR